MLSLNFFHKLLRQCLLNNVQLHLLMNYFYVWKKLFPTMYPVKIIHFLLKFFFQKIYVPAVCFESNVDPINQPSLSIVKSFLYLCSHYGRMTKTTIDQLRTVHLPSIMAKHIQNSLVNSLTLRASRQLLVNTLTQYLDELARKYHQNSVTLKLISARLIRRSMIKLNEEQIEQLNIAQHIKRVLWLPTSIGSQ